ncbi:hypothetical protein RCU50_13060 [Escherichia coli]|nr:hypothetical protein [Escherichia coli]MED0201650.1 hypothetical protein [Escherichia coli]MED9116044.1 hypothetical protein [Escherichia coli]MED9141370.1 hypothetical protein [Escherichia coli]
MNDGLKICRRILQTTGGVALLLWGGCAGAGDNSGGVPGILKFAQQYQQQEASAIKEGGQAEKRTVSPGLSEKVKQERAAIPNCDVG